MANRASRKRCQKKSKHPSSSGNISVHAPELNGKYKIIQKIDHGGYAIVYKAIDLKKTTKNHTKYVAIKRIKTYNLNSNHVDNALCIELEILHKFRWHEHFPTINEVLLDKASGTYSIIMEYFEHLPFSEYNQTLNEEQIIKYIHVLLTCIDKLSNHGIIHRDIKPQNFLFNPQQNKYVLIDFGLCQFESSIKSEHQRRQKLINQSKKATSKRYALRSSKGIKDNAPRDGTPQFRAPEIVLGSTDQDSRIDIFNAGLILALLMLRSNVLFTPTSDYQAIAQFIAVYGLKEMRETADALNRNLEIRGLSKKEQIHFNNGKDSLLSKSYVTGYENCAQNEESGLARWVKCRVEYLRKNKGEIGCEWSEELYDLLHRLTACNMYKRLTPKSALQHKIFSKLNCS